MCSTCDRIFQGDDHTNRRRLVEFPPEHFADTQYSLACCTEQRLLE
jgi:hypothetical protein